MATHDDKPLIAGFGCHKQSEAVDGVLPEGRNSPQHVAHGLYTEKLSGTAFTAPRAKNFRSWFYRIRPSVVQGRFEPLALPLLRTAPDADAALTPNQLRWRAFDIDTEGDFVDGLCSLATTGDAHAHSGIGVHIYRATRSMETRFFYNADGELLIVPQDGGIRVHSECGVLDAAPGDVVLMPRGMKFRVVLVGESARGYICENYGRPFELPERGPIGSDGLANDRDFLTPHAAFEDREGDFELVAKFGGGLFRASIDRSPLDVVAWHGNLVPYKYDLRRFNTIGSISYDHPDPSIFTVLTSPSDTPGTANADFVIFPPRWLVMEQTFRPPWFHRNVMSEFMGLIYGDYDAKSSSGFAPGSCSLHNCMSPHGPDTESYAAAIAEPMQPKKLDDTMAFMFEARTILKPSQYAVTSEYLDTDYSDCWAGLKPGMRD